MSQIMMDQDQVELQHISSQTSHPARYSAPDRFQPTCENTRVIPPADVGKDAWLFLAACFVMEAVVWGFPSSFGLFQEYLSTHEPFASQGNTAVIGTCAMGIIYLSGPVVFPILRKWPNQRRLCVVAGLLTMCIALAASSFSQTVFQLILSQGIGYGVGGAFAYCTTILFLDEWFIKRKGLAFGIMWAGTGIAGLVIPLVMQWILDAHGFRTALRTWSITLFVLTAPLLYWIKPRLPVHPNDREHSRGKLFNISFLQSPQFWVLEAGNIIEAFGFFLPQIYLPMFAQQAFKASPLASASTLIVLNTTSVIGCVAMGSLIDHYHVSTCILISTVGATIGIFLFWGLSTNITMLYVFCAIYGLFAGSFSSTWTGISRYIQKKSSDTDTGMVFAALAFGRGIGNITSGPISNRLLKGRQWSGSAALAYGSGYGPLIVYTGLSALLGGCSFVARRSGLL